MVSGTAFQVNTTMPITPVGFTWLSKHVTYYYVDIMFGRDLNRQKMLHDWTLLSAYMLACGICEGHFLKYQEENPLPEIKEYEPGETPYLRWSIRAHNAVRERQNKPLADEDTVVLTYKSGKIYGAEAYLPLPKTRASLASNTPPTSDGDSSGSSGVGPENINTFKVATYILGSVLGVILLAGVIYAGVRVFRKQLVPELSE